MNWIAVNATKIMTIDNFNFEPLFSRAVRPYTYMKINKKKRELTGNLSWILCAYKWIVKCRTWEIASKKMYFSCNSVIALIFVRVKCVPTSKPNSFFCHLKKKILIFRIGVNGQLLFYNSFFPFIWILKQ